MHTQPACEYKGRCLAEHCSPLCRVRALHFLCTIRCDREDIQVGGGGFRLAGYESFALLILQARRNQVPGPRLTSTCHTLPLPAQTRTADSYMREWSQAELQLVRIAQMEAVRTGRVSATHRCWCSNLARWLAKLVLPGRGGCLLLHVAVSAVDLGDSLALAYASSSLGLTSSRPLHPCPDTSWTTPPSWTWAPRPSAACPPARTAPGRTTTSSTPSRPQVGSQLACMKTGKHV